MKCFAIKNPQGEIIFLSITATDDVEIINHYLHSDYQIINRNIKEYGRWLDLEKQGYTCVPVIVSEETEDRPNDTLNDIISGLKCGKLEPIEAHDRILKLFNSPLKDKEDK